MRNKEIYEIEERDLKDVKSILLELFNNKITYENIKIFKNTILSLEPN